MEYNELIEKVRHTAVDTPDTDAILDGMHHTMRRRRQRQTTAVAAVCLLLAVVPLTFRIPLSTSHPHPTLVETVSATLPSSPNDLPAPLAGYKNSLRNHQIETVI